MKVIQRSFCEFSDKQMNAIFKESLVNKSNINSKNFLQIFWMNEVDYFISFTRWQFDVSKRWKNISLVEELTQSANLMLFYKWSKKWFLVDCIDISDFSTYWRREWYFNEKISDIDNSTKSLSSL